MSTAKAKINLKEGQIELEGSEEFVSKQLEHFKEYINTYRDSSESIDKESQVTNRVSNETKTETQVATNNNQDKKARKKTATGKAPAIESEKFDYLKDGEILGLKDFFQSKSPGANANTGNIIATIGYYIQFVRKLPHFTEGNIDFAYRILELKGRPKFMRQIIINNKNTRDLFEPVDNINGAWKLTRAAEIFVDEQLPIEVNK